MKQISVLKDLNLPFVLVLNVKFWISNLFLFLSECQDTRLYPAEPQATIMTQKILYIYS